MLVEVNCERIFVQQNLFANFDETLVINGVTERKFNIKVAGA